MAFVINKIASGQTPAEIAQAFLYILNGSRFRAEVITKRSSVEIRQVRLTYKKDYCGNHPLPCPVRSFHVPHKRMTFLEGADWVAFNDMLNDVLDVLECVCNAASSHVVIRKAGARCIRYDAQRAGIGNEWKKDSGAFQWCIGTTNVTSAAYPPGTPGFATHIGKPNYPEKDHHDH